MHSFLLGDRNDVVRVGILGQKRPDLAKVYLMGFGILGIIVGIEVDAGVFMSGQASLLDEFFRNLIGHENTGNSAEFL